MPCLPFNYQRENKMSLDKLSVLYVEDEEEIISLMQELLEDEVGVLHIARNGEEGLMMYEKYKPDIVLSDIYMPKIDGLSMSETIKKQYPDQPIILLTAFNNVNDLKRAISIGIDNYINKPVQTQEQLNNPLEKIAKKIDDKKELELLSQRIEKQSKFAAIGEVLGLITHQWKQPLGAISAEIASIQLKKQLGTLEEKDISELIDITSERIQYLTQTINDFKDYLKPKEMPKAFELSSVFRQITTIIGNKLSMNNITFVIPQTTFSIVGYHNKLLHVLINIISNACDALSDSGTENKYIIIDVTQEKENCHISVKDSAGGIPKEIINDIFQPYFTTKEDQLGTGLGLYMSREFIVGHMHGELSVENVSYEFEGKNLVGAQFNITFPIKMAL